MANANALPSFDFDQEVEILAGEYAGFFGHVNRRTQRREDEYEWSYGISVTRTPGGDQYTAPEGRRAVTTLLESQLKKVDPLFELNFGKINTWQAWAFGVNLMKASDDSIVATGFELLRSIIKATTDPDAKARKSQLAQAHLLRLPDAVRIAVKDRYQTLNFLPSDEATIGWRREELETRRKAATSNGQAVTA